MPDKGAWRVIKLAKAPAFAFKFPDGHWINSREITLRTLVERGMHIDQYGDYALTHWHPDLSPLASLVGRYQYFSFRIEEDGTVSSLELGVCGEAFDDVLRTMDGVTYGFPLTVKDVERIFGPISKIDH